MRRYTSVLFTLMALLLLACQGQDGHRIPDTQPDMKGYITSLKKTSVKKKAGAAILLVEAMDGVQTNYPKATLKLNESTYIEMSDGAALRLEHLREGQIVEAWFEGQVMESDPVQAQVSAIRVSN